MNLFHQQAWFSDPAEEPPVKSGDPFIISGYILNGAKSRFSAFVHYNHRGGKFHCRIKHYVEDGDEALECAHKTARLTGAIAHVCDYLNYRPYKCQGKGMHAAW